VYGRIHNAAVHLIELALALALVLVMIPTRWVFEIGEGAPSCVVQVDVPYRLER